MTNRLRRTQRRGGARIHLQPRDEMLIRTLNRFRLARSGDLARLYFPGRHRDVCASRFRRLYDAGYLETHVPDLAAPNLYSLGPRGKAWLRGQGSVVRPLPRPPWEHHLGVVGIWSRLAAAAHRHRGARLVRFVPEVEVREQGIGATARVVPDVLAEFKTAGPEPQGMARVVIELDRGTESLAVLREKIRALHLARLDGAVLGWKDFGLVVALEAAGIQREPKVHELLTREWPGRREPTWSPKSRFCARSSAAPSRTPAAVTGGPMVQAPLLLRSRP
jgi:hypothetical protein